MFVSIQHPSEPANELTDPIPGTVSNWPEKKRQRTSLGHRGHPQGRLSGMQGT